MANSFEFNGISKDYVKVIERGRPYWSPFKREIRTHKRAHRLTQTEYEPMAISVTIRVEADSKEQLLLRGEEIAAWLITENEAPLIFDDNKNRTHWAVLDGAVSVDEIVSFSTVTLEFISLYKTGAVHALELTKVHESFLIKGQLPAPWKSKTTFTAKADKFTLESNLGFIELNYPFIVGDVLEIDYKNRDIKVSGLNIDVGLSLESVWFKLETGSRDLKASEKTTISYAEIYH